MESRCCAIMSTALLLDTYAVLRIAEGDVADAVKRSIDSAAAQGNILVSPISAWEIATLVRKGRVVLSMDPLSWFERMLVLPGIGLAPMPPSVLIASAFLPGSPPADPADRILIATARAGNFTILTRDHEILAYAARGNVHATRC